LRIHTLAGYAGYVMLAKASIHKVLNAWPLSGYRLSPVCEVF